MARKCAFARPARRSVVRRHKAATALPRLVAQSQQPDGTFHPFPPSNYPIVSNADWAAEWVGALYDDYLWTGETARIETYWPQVEAFWRHVLPSVDPEGPGHGGA